ncbi:sulfatase family protein [Pelagicoccus mobilis]|uniref:Sulfatase-like hydrolase/transferase n=2 Tax=Pelagicoccus mobilis TaxID=415221 RepID=A0A934VQF3_9BACT|nr:sulfatase-like hydrolase/transferase [Pelagicoccus mobilis]MBK1876518.1 sulfatase-like hydrolase/transferase [Pelagicoccus mobilis]
MKNHLSLFLLTLVSVLAPALQARQPNVIVIFTDDQGAVDTGAYGADDLVTPNMDRIAERGVRFTQFYAAAPVCSPSRVGLLTGRTPQHGGLKGNVPPGGEGMPSAQITIAEELKQAGYATAHIGKWHLGHHEDTVPNGQGFDHSFGHMVGCIDNYSHYFYWNGPNRHDLWRNGEEVFHDGEFFADLMVTEAEEFMKANREDPFFIYFALNSPHYPYQGSPEWLEHYKDLPYPRNLYAAFLSTMDERIGDLLGAVDDLGLKEETIVIFQSDHGHSEEVRAHGGGGSAGPYRGAKFSLYEGGIRVPAIISWPGQLPENQVRSQMATGCDWYPTILDLCGLSSPEHAIDGKSLLPLIDDAAAETAHSSFNWKTGKNGKDTAVRAGQWKLIKSGEQTELYNIEKDPGEQTNLAVDRPKVVKRLSEISEEYWKGFAGDS